MKGLDKVEQILWNYRKNAESLKDMKKELSGLMSVQGASYKAHAMNGVSEPVLELVSRIISMEKRIASLEREVKAVENLASSLDIREKNMYQMSMILRYRYVKHIEHEAVMRQLGMSKATYFRRSGELLRLAGKYMR